MELIRVVALVAAAVGYRARMQSGPAKAESPAYLHREDEEALRALREAAMAIAPGDVEKLYRLLVASGGGAR